MSPSGRAAGARPVTATPAGVRSCWRGGTDGTAALPAFLPAAWRRAIPGRGPERPGEMHAGVAGLPGDPAAIVTGALAGPGLPA
jgi:hypothetical protein